MNHEPFREAMVKEPLETIIKELDKKLIELRGYL